MSGALHAGWSALLDVHDAHPTRWTLVGGQMVHLWCAERGTRPTRPTDDLDTVLDVRASPRVLLTFTSALKELGFVPAGTSPTGHQHRWVRDGAQIDVLIPRGVGERAARRKGAGGGTTLETPGAQQALDRTQDVPVSIGNRTGTVRRPNLLGALVAKAAAHTVTLDRARRRHLTDFLVLCTLVEHGDQIEEATRRDRQYLHAMLGSITDDQRAVASVTDADHGIHTLRLALGLQD
ncbi:MAG: hypothetical protein FWD11_08585 [Micrococcales bacterium]|nr:hypothetical protein [Micrococcales bacterium]